MNIYRRKDIQQRAFEKLVKQNVSNKEDDPAEVVAGVEIQGNLKSELLKLPEQEREAFELYYLPPGLSFKDIAKKFGVSLSTARNYVERGMNKLRRML